MRPELRFDLRAALHRALERNQPSLSLPIPVQFNGAPKRVFLQVKPVALEKDGTWQALVFFIEGDPIGTGEANKESPNAIKPPTPRSET